jgi:sec-independent protein translocase protein TatC
MSEVVKVSGNRENPNKEMTLIQHLDELRRRLFRSLIVIIIFAIVAFFFKDLIFDHIILNPREPDFITNRLFCKIGNLINVSSLCINTQSFQIINIQLAGQFKAHLMVSFIFGLMFSFPFLIYQIWKFVRPALNIKDIKNVNIILLSVSTLFAIGVLFGYFLIIPLTINFLSTYQVSESILNQISFSSYLSILTGISLATGLVFELPVLIFFLSKIGLVTPQLLKKYRKHAIVIFFITSGIITPPDIFSQVLVAVPLYLLYEISIKISAKVFKKQVLMYGDD